MNVMLVKFVSILACLPLFYPRTSDCRTVHRMRRHWKRIWDVTHNTATFHGLTTLQTDTRVVRSPSLPLDPTTTTTKDEPLNNSGLEDRNSIWKHSPPEQTIVWPVNGNASLTNITVSLIEFGQLPAKMYDWYPDLTQNNTVHSIFIILYGIVMLSAVIGNILVCHTVLSNRKMQTVVNYYILNLALCDLLVGIFVLPSKAIELLVPPSVFSLNELLCSTLSFLQTVVVFASVLTLVATCFERYFAIVHPLKSRMQQSKRRTGRILVLVWTVSAIASAPFFMKPSTLSVNTSTSQYGEIVRSTCADSFDDTFRTIYYTVLFVFFYLLPLSLIAFTSFCIAKSLLSTSLLRRQGSLLRQEINRRKIGKMILIVVACFTVSWTPYFVVTIVTQYQSENFMQKHDYYFTMLSINLFAFVHSAINPLIYATMSTRFRQAFCSSIHTIVHCRPIQRTVLGNVNTEQQSSRFSFPHNGRHTDTCASNSSQTVKVNASEYLPMMLVHHPDNGQCDNNNHS